MKALLLLPISAIITLTLALWKTTRVTSQADLSHVAFGWPLQWIVQDQSRFNWARYPQHARLTFIKFDQLPTSVDWVLFGANIAIIAALLLAAYACLPWVGRVLGKKSNITEKR